MVLFVVLAAAVIDLSWFWTNNLRMQRAADAAALAGVIFLPGREDVAITAARVEATKNGYTNGAGGFTVTPVKDPTNSRRLKVNIRGPVGTFFARAVGITAWTASRDSKADFVLPVPMGSPENYYGVGFYEGRVAGPDPGSRQHVRGRQLERPRHRRSRGGAVDHAGRWSRQRQFVHHRGHQLVSARSGVTSAG